MAGLDETRDSLDAFFRRSSVPPLPWDVRETLLWTAHPDADAHREYVIRAFEQGQVTDAQGEAVLATLSSLVRRYLGEHRDLDAARTARFGTRLAGVTGSRDRKLEFESLAATAYWGQRAYLRGSL